MALNNCLYDTIWVYKEIRKRTTRIIYTATFTITALPKNKKRKADSTQILKSHRSSKLYWNILALPFILFQPFCVLKPHKKPNQPTKNRHRKLTEQTNKKKTSKNKSTSELLAWNTAGCCPSARCQWLKAPSLAGNSKDVWLAGRNTSTSSGMKDLKFWVPLKLQRFAELSSLAQRLWILRPSSCSDVCLNKFF